MNGSLRSLPRLFVEGASPAEPFELPEAEVKKLRHVLRLSSGAKIAVLPNDGSLMVCELQGHQAVPIETVWPDTEPKIRVMVAQALPKGDKIDEIVKAGTGLGAAGFRLFAADRTVVRWDEKKVQDRLRRLRAIAREEAEVSFRTRVPTVEMVSDLKKVLEGPGQVVVLSESEEVVIPMPTGVETVTLVVGPEGGWSPRELEMIGNRGVTLGPRVLRVEYAAAAALAKLLI